MRFSVVNLGCKVNRVESDSYEAALAAAGAAPAPLPEADVIIVNTYTVTGEAEKKTRKAVRGALNRNPQARVIVTGCAAAIAPDAFASMSERVRVVPKAGMDAVLADIGAELDGAAACQIGASRARRGVKVQDGCDNACTYCIVHVARSRARSMSAQQVMRECAELARTGVREIVLTGINLGTYRDGVLDLAALLVQLMDATAHLVDDAGRPCRFRISSVEPGDVDDALIDVLASAEGRVCRHLHLPLQSGSSAVLRQMARPYDSAGFADTVARIVRAVPTISLSTDAIVGFPGETDADFEQTMQLVRAVGFSKVHVFPYSERKGTPAAARADQVPFEVRAQRARALRQLSDELREADFLARCGRIERCVVEERGRARTESYHEVRADGSLAEGSFADIELVRDGRLPDTGA